MTLRVHRGILSAAGSGLKNRVSRLSPAAWYQPGVGLTGSLTVSNWADQSGNGRDLAQSTAGNQPINLPHTGTDYAYLPGVAGNYFSTPDSSSFPTGDIDIRVRAALDNWAATGQAFVGKRLGGNSLQLTSAGSNANQPVLYWWDGAALKSAAATVGWSISAGVVRWFRATLDVDNGAGGCAVKFYTSSDDVANSADVSTWTQLGATVTQAFTTSIDDTASVLTVGTDGSAGFLLVGKIYRAQIYNGIDGTLAVDFDPSRFVETSTNGATAVASTGETWTLNSTGAYPATIVKSSQILFGGVDEYLNTASFSINQPVSIYLVMKQVTWTSNDVIYSGTNIYLHQKVGGASPQITASAGTPSSVNSNLAVGSYGIVTTVFNGASSTLQVNNTTAVTGDFGSGGISGGFWLGDYYSLGIPSNIIVKEVLIFSAAHTAAQRAVVRQYLAVRHQIAL